MLLPRWDLGFVVHYFAPETKTQIETMSPKSESFKLDAGASMNGGIPVLLDATVLLKLLSTLGFDNACLL